MATIAFNDSESSVSDPPPSYDSAFYASVPADSIQRKPSVFSFLRSKQKYRRAVLSRIHEIVSSPNFTLAPVAPIVKACAAALPAAVFSMLLQTHNIENHTALYWAIVNNRREALLEFIKFIPEFSPACSSDLRLACMIVNDHDLFMLLNLGDNVNPDDRSSRRMLGCPRDDVQVHEGGGIGKSYFVVYFFFRMFQKRLRIAQELGVEFVARGRVWVLQFHMGKKGKWHIAYGLSEHSFPVHPLHAEVQIKANKPSSGSDIPKHLRLHSLPSYASYQLVPEDTLFAFLCLGIYGTLFSG